MAAVLSTQRLLRFIIGCMGLRYSLTYLSKVNPSALPILGYGAVAVAVGLTAIHFLGLRKTGIETDGEPIWWDHLRLVHGALLATFGYMAINGNPESWKVLFADTTLGLIAWVMHRKLISL